MNQAKGWHETIRIGMRIPVKCRRCARGLYDLCDVTFTQLSDGHSTWNAPCCGALVDDYQTPTLRILRGGS